VPALWFREPCYETGKAVWWQIGRVDRQLMSLAAIWETRRLDDERIQSSFSLLTIAAAGHPLMRRFHGRDDEKRSVVPIADADHARWLDAKDEADLRSLLRLFEPAEFEATPAQKIR
jgi:putative SOS response-associated peptidase YedK